ncbi:MAG TPA: phosphatidate cytidylyltransferase [Caulobacterales bacterium]|nr:phosphatidate cytidylyltransferase [Caulobacterales bacterium]
MNTGAAIGGSEPRTQKPPHDAAALDLTGSEMNAAPAPADRHDWSDLGLRILSSIILIPAGLFAARAGGPWLAGAAGAAVVAMSYEWARMSEPNGIRFAFPFALAGALGAVMLASWREWGLAAGWLCLCAAASATRRRSASGIVETAGGLLYIGSPAAVFLWLRARAPEGWETVLTLFLVIWAADVAAYFGGKLIGGPKVAEGLSPNKTWSGIIAGAFSGCAAGLGCAALFGSHSYGAWAGVGLALAFTGLMGDLFESFLKRRFGVKDASRLIPGHGGVLDRIDGLMAATLLTGAVLALWPPLSAFLTGAGP